jgi:ribosomal protein S18 acetylase RimI-like enzyme
MDAPKPSAVEILDEAQCIELEAALVDHLYRFNAKATGCDDGKLIGGSIRADSGELMGGFSGHTWGGVCVVTHLWVAEAYRGLGIGRSLLQNAEAQARRRHCTWSILTTHSFQAQEFYERVGYRRVSSVEDWPVGYSNVLYRKRLDGEIEATSNLTRS